MTRPITLPRRQLFVVQAMRRGQRLELVRGKAGQWWRLGEARVKGCTVDRLRRAGLVNVQPALRHEAAALTPDGQLAPLRERRETRGGKA